MLKTREIFERIKLDNKEQYKEMLEQVNIPDFYKCIAQYTGLNINEIADEAMIEYLRIVSSETPFLLRNEGEVSYTVEAEEHLLENKNLCSIFPLKVQHI